MLINNDLKDTPVPPHAGMRVVRPSERCDCCQGQEPSFHQVAVLDFFITLVVVGVVTLISDQIKRKKAAAEKRTGCMTSGSSGTRQTVPSVPQQTHAPQASIVETGRVARPTDIVITDFPLGAATSANVGILEPTHGLQSTDISIQDHIIDLHDFELVEDACYAPLDGLAPGSAEAQARQKMAVEMLGLPLEIKTRVTGIRLRLIPPGEFMMGSPENEQDRLPRQPLHRVTITQPFYIGAYEVTQGQWRKVMGSNHSQFKEVGENAPVEQVSWNACQEFLRRLEDLEGLGSNRVRLPTEAEWEYACRAGTKTPFCFGDRLDSSMANFDGNYPYGGAQKGVYRQKTTPVGSFKPNAWGLYDMHGNVWEWCADWRGEYSGDATDPTGPASGSYRVIRGGSWYRSARDCRSAYRYGSTPGYAYNGIGFRVSLPAGQ